MSKNKVGKKRVGKEEYELGFYAFVVKVAT